MSECIISIWKDTANEYLQAARDRRQARLLEKRQAIIAIEHEEEVKE